MARRRRGVLVEQQDLRAAALFDPVITERAGLVRAAGDAAFLVHDPALRVTSSSTAMASCLHTDRAMGTARTNRATINVLELLTEQHREVDELFEQIEQRKGNVRAAFTELADKLAAHAAVEEKIFYPQSMSSQTSELLHESVEEHLAIKRVLADLLTMELSSDEFDAKLSVLKESVSHHAHEEEEGKLFPILRKQMDEDQLGALGNEVLALFEQLMASHPARNVPAETAEAAPLPSAT